MKTDQSELKGKGACWGHSACGRGGDLAQRSVEVGAWGMVERAVQLQPSLEWGHGTQAQLAGGSAGPRVLVSFLQLLLPLLQVD